MYAVTGRMLMVNLETGNCVTEDIPEQLYSNYLGGYGIGLPLIMERMDPAIDPLDSRSILGFASGYLTGTGSYIASRYMVFGKSPSTLGWGDSNSGGYFGKKMKEAGFDVILFSGKSAKPVYLSIDSGEARLEDAKDIWGKDTYATEDYLKEKHGKDTEVACIGPAGERISMIAGISTDKGRYAARSALGALMGSKNLKAIVAKGKLKISIHDSEKLKNLRKKYLKIMKEDLGSLLSKYGTPTFYETAMIECDTPFKNWSSSIEEFDTESNTITAENYLKYQVKGYACSGCPIGCGGHMKLDKGPFKIESTVHKVEYETTGIFGSNLLNGNIEALIKINDICNRYGMDTISCGGLCAFAVECYERGIINSEMTDGLELKWGDAEAIVTLVEKIGKSEGIGGILAQGFEKAIEAFGEESRQYAIHIRNEGLPAHDPRWSAGLALTYYSDPTPSRHTQGSTTFPIAGYDMPDIPVHEAKGRAKAHLDNVILTHALNAMGLCLFGYIILDYKIMPEFLEAVDGREWTTQKIMEIGQRINLMRYLFNRKAGSDFMKFDFPERVLGNPPLTTGPTKGIRIDLDTMVKEYLEELKWDYKTNMPSKELYQLLRIDSYI